MGLHPLPQPIKLSDSGPPPNANFFPAGKREFLQGSGSPENLVEGDAGDEYRDLDSGNKWVKMTGINGGTSGWSLEDGTDGSLVATGFALATESPANGTNDDSDMLQRALDAQVLATRHGVSYGMRKIVIPSPPAGGYYRITRPLIIRHHGVCVQGESVGVLIKNVTANSDVFQVNPIEDDEDINDPVVQARVLYNVRIERLMLIGTGSASRAVYAQQTDHLIVDVDTTQHPGTSTYQESAPKVAGLTGYGYAGCFFSWIRVLAQPSADVTCIYDINGRSNIYENCRVMRGNKGFHFVDCDANVIRSPYIEQMNRGTADGAIYVRASTTFKPTKWSLKIDGGYCENSTNYFVDSDDHTFVQISAITLTGGTGDHIKLSGGGELTGVSSTAGSRVTSNCVVDVKSCANIYGRSSALRSVGVTNFPFASQGTNLALQSWCDTSPTWTTGGGHPPTLADALNDGFLGKNSKTATFPTGAIDYNDSKAILGNATIVTTSGDRINAIVAIKFSRASESMLFRFNTETAVSFPSDTEWMLFFLSAETKQTSEFISLAPVGLLGSNIVATVGGIAIAKNATAVLTNTEGSSDFQVPRGLYVSDRGAATASPKNGQIENVGGVLFARSESLWVQLYKRVLGSSFAITNNVGAGEDDLTSYTVAAGLMATNGDALLIHVAGSYAANANDKTVKLYFAGSAIFNTTALAINNGTWNATIRIVRRSATTQWVSVQFMTSDALLLARANVLSLGATLGNANIFKVTGESGSANSNDVQQWYQHVELLKAP